MTTSGVRNDRRNYAVVGTFVIAMAVAGALWIAVLAGRTGSQDVYQTRFANVMGLGEGAAVHYQGYRVGTVETIQRLEAEAPEPGFRISMRVREGWSIPEDSIATIASSGILGAVGIEIQGGASQRATPPGGEIESRERADPFAAVGAVAERMGELVEDLAPLLQELGEGAPEIVSNLRTLTEQLNESARQLGEIISPENAERVSEILVEMHSATRGSSRLASDLQRTRERADTLLASMDAVVGDNRDDVRLAVEDLRTSLDALALSSGAILTNLESASRDLAEFGDQIRRDPSLILRGREGDDR